MSAPEERSGREIRLLMLVIIVAVAGLLVLARFRFPAADIVTVTQTPSPLDRIAVRAPFDELGTAAAAAAARVTPLVAVVEAEPVPETPPRKGSRGSAQAPAPLPQASQWLPALRVSADHLLVYVPSHMRPVRLGGWPVRIVGEDLQRGLTLVSVDRVEGTAAAPMEVADFAGAASGLSAYRYVLAVEAAQAGPAARPIFLPRVDAVTAESWDSPVWRIGGQAEAGTGTFLFTMGGRLIGMTVPHEQGVAIVVAATLDRLARDLARAPSGGQ